MCCRSSVHQQTKLRSQQLNTVNQLEAKSEYEAAMNMHLHATNKNRAVKKNREARLKKKQYR